MHPVDHANLRRRVEGVLAAFLKRQRGVLAGIDPALTPIADALDDFVIRGGKRLRPAFAYWGFIGAGGADGEEIVAAAAALELVQASALIHDDVMDRSDTRRGEPSVHRRFAAIHSAASWGGDPDAYGAATAILLGDFCLAWSDELLHDCGLSDEALRRARPDFDAMRTEVIAGQYLDLHNQATGDTSLERASIVARYKSAKYTVERPLLWGAALAGADDKVRVAFSEYGLPLGEAFQLRDDILGVFGDPRQTGKPAGDDLREGKRTYLVAATFAGADPAATVTMRAGLGDRSLDEAGVAALRDIIFGTGALARTEARITALTEDALATLASVPLAGDARDVLTKLAQAATSRTE